MNAYDSQEKPNDATLSLSAPKVHQTVESFPSNLKSSTLSNNPFYSSHELTFVIIVIQREREWALRESEKKRARNSPREQNTQPHRFYGLFCPSSEENFREFHTISTLQRKDAAMHWRCFSAALLSWDANSSKIAFSLLQIRGGMQCNGIILPEMGSDYGGWNAEGRIIAGGYIIKHVAKWVTVVFFMGTKKGVTRADDRLKRNWQSVVSICRWFSRGTKLCDGYKSIPAHIRGLEPGDGFLLVP